MRLYLLVILSLLASCSIVRKAEEALDKANRILESVEVEKSVVHDVLDNVAQGAAQLGEQGQVVLEKIAEARGVVEDADKNQDGKIAGLEWWELLMGLLGLFGIGKGGEAVVNLAKDRAAHRQETRELKQAVEVLKNGKSAA